MRLNVVRNKTFRRKSHSQRAPIYLGLVLHLRSLHVIFPQSLDPLVGLAERKLNTMYFKFVVLLWWIGFTRARMHFRESRKAASLCPHWSNLIAFLTDRFDHQGIHAWDRDGEVETQSQAQGYRSCTK